jgi:hypothetical protein
LMLLCFRIVSGAHLHTGGPWCHQSSHRAKKEGTESDAFNNETANRMANEYYGSVLVL